MRIYLKAIMPAIIIAAFMILPAMAQDGANSISTVSSPSARLYSASGGLDLGQSREDMSYTSELSNREWARSASITNDEEISASATTNADEEEEGHGSEATEEAPPGGFDRLWDVVSNG